MPREIALSAGVLLGAACLFAASGPAVILNSGSTNTAGFRLTIEKSGNAEFAPMPRKYGPQSPGSTESARYKLPDAVVRRFYSDLEAARPLGNLPRTRCMKSASFGTNTIIQFGGEENQSCLRQGPLSFRHGDFGGSRKPSSPGLHGRTGRRGRRIVLAAAASSAAKTRLVFRFRRRGRFPIRISERGRYGAIRLAGEGILFIIDAQ